MSASRQTAIMMAQYKKAVATPCDHIKYYMEENNPLSWWVLLHNFSGDNDEWSNGEYLLNVKAPANFPFAPPEFYFHTPNGLYNLNCKICVSIGEFHSKDYRPTLGMSGFVNQLWSGMIGWKTLGHGINIIDTTLAEKKKLATSSYKYNMANHANIIAQIESCYASYSKMWKLESDVSTISGKEEM